MGKVDLEDQMYEAAQQSAANFGQPDDLEMSLQNLQKALEAGNYTAPADLVQGAVLQTKDLSEIANRYLTPQTQLDLQNRAKTQVIKTDDGRVYRSIYFSTIVKTGNEEAGIREMAKIANDLSQQGLIYSCLAPVSSIELAITSSVAKSAVFFFPIVPQECVNDCQVKYAGYFTLEGGIGEDLEDTSVQLAEGEFLAEIAISHTMTMMVKENPKDMFQRRVDEFLRFLPDDTEVRQVTELAIYDLARRYEVKFYNRRLQRVKKVELDYIREIAVFDPSHPEFRKDQVEQFNLLMGVRYLDKDGKDLYRYNDGSL